MKPRDLLPLLPHEGPPIPRFLANVIDREKNPEKGRRLLARAMTLSREVQEGQTTREEAVSTLLKESDA